MNRPVSIAGVADLKMCCLVTDNNMGNRLLKKSTLIHIHYSYDNDIYTSGVGWNCQDARIYFVEEEVGGKF